MSRKGGYIIIDLKCTALTAGTASTIPGIYDAIEGNYYKALLLSGLKIGGTEFADCTVQAVISSDDYIIKAYGYKLTITDDDEVTAALDIAANVPKATGTAPTKAEFDALITSLINAGIMAAPEGE